MTEALTPSISWTLSSPKLRLVDIRNNLLETIPGLLRLLDQHEGIQQLSKNNGFIDSHPVNSPVKLKCLVLCPISLSLSCNRLTLDALLNLPRCPNAKVLGLFSNFIDHSSDETPIEGDQF